MTTEEKRKEAIRNFETRIKEIRGNKAPHQLTLAERLEINTLQTAIEQEKRS